MNWLIWFEIKPADNLWQNSVIDVCCCCWTGFFKLEGQYRISKGKREKNKKTWTHWEMWLGTVLEVNILGKSYFPAAREGSLYRSLFFSRGIFRKQLRNAATRTFHDPNAIYSELILWRVDHIGPLSCTGGVSELARINSLHTSAFSNVAWLPTLVPSSVLGQLTHPRTNKHTSLKTLWAFLMWLMFNPITKCVCVFENVYV